LLCYVMENIEDNWQYGTRILDIENKPGKLLRAEVLAWWEDHKRLDEEERLKHLAENARQLRAMRILAKLNEEFSEEEIEDLKDLI
jgi:hypothetical protein